MPENKLNGREGANFPRRESVIIDTNRVLDCCKDKDCFEDTRVMLTDYGQEILEKSGSIRVLSTKVVWTDIVVDPVKFNRGFYQVTIRFFTKITLEACVCVGKSQELEGIAVTEKKVVLSVGRFSYEKGYGKGYDILLKVSEKLDGDTGVYIVGDEPTEEFVKLKEEKNLEHVHYIGFKEKNALAEYYAAADVFVLLTRGDVWGLVINEAMMFGLPVITTYQCIAGTELVKDGVNGYLSEPEDIQNIEEKIKKIIDNPEMKTNFGRESLKIIAPYTIENMAKEHLNQLGGVLLP